EKLEKTIAVKRPGLLDRSKVISYHDNARLYSVWHKKCKKSYVNSVRKFYALQHSFLGKKFDSVVSTGNNIENHFNEKPKKFCVCNIFTF
ncbi:hypothetical protein WH47_05235, partial [Habropoda laboriosa]